MPRLINNHNRIEIRKNLRKSQTKEEGLLWSKLRNNNIGYKWKRQVSIGPYIADFYCSKKLLVVEADGSQHLENTEYDKEREEFFKSLGIKTLRFWNNEITKNMDGVVSKIKEVLDNRSTSPQPSPVEERG